MNRMFTRKTLTPVAGFLSMLALFLAAGCRPHSLSGSLERVLPGESATQPLEEQKPTFANISLRAQAGRTSVIMYHDIIKERDKDSVWFDVTTDEFQKDIDFILQNGFTVLTMDQLYEHLTEGKPIPQKSVVLTFDDNYQGFYDNALPILKQHGLPATVFVHTGFVGSQVGHPKMTWDELKELVSGGLVTIGAHTITHPDKFADLPADVQRKELIDSKAKLEEMLGVPVPYMAYPVGSNSEVTRDLAKEAGYKMSFTMEPTPAEASPNILAVGRYESKKFEEALTAQMNEIAAVPQCVVDVTLKDVPIDCQVGTFEGIKLAIIKGGRPMSLQAQGRKSVGDFVKENQAVAGINGTFFSAAAVASDDNKLIGPCRPANVGLFMPDPDPTRLKKLVDRPMVIWGPTRLAIANFVPGCMNAESIYHDFMPDYTDAFLAGTWLVHDGLARAREHITIFASKDIQDYRKRAFFGVTKEGTMICGASMGSITSDQLGKAAAAAGAQEAVLLDSGFSTSLIYDDLVLASGHSNADHPSRPVPHAIVLMGQKGTADLGSFKPVRLGELAMATEEPAKTRRRHRRRS
jgi:peptidoglycan/xylan/chitin deacetylase (PgdA/CDA1 family)